MNETFLCTANDLAIGYGKRRFSPALRWGCSPARF